MILDISYTNSAESLALGSYFKSMLGKATVERLTLGKGTVVGNTVVKPDQGGSGSGEGGLDENPLG